MVYTLTITLKAFSQFVIKEGSITTEKHCIKSHTFDTFEIKLLMSFVKVFRIMVDGFTVEK